MEKEAMEKREQLLAEIVARRNEYARTVKKIGVDVPELDVGKKSGQKSIDDVCRAMQVAELAQKAVIAARKRITEKELDRINPSRADKWLLQNTEKLFLNRHTEFEKAYNKAHVQEYVSTQRKAGLIARIHPEYEPYKYNRDALDEAIADQARKGNICVGNESFAETIVNTRYVKGDFGTKYMDGKVFLSKNSKKDIDPLDSVEMLSVGIKDVLTNNPNVPVAGREPKSAEEQKLMAMKIKAAIVTNNEDMISFIEETKIEQALAKQEIALEESRFELGVIAEKAFSLQQSIVEKRTDRDILRNCGKDLSKRDQKLLDKQTDKLEKCVDTIDKRLDKILTFNKMDKEDYWQQIEMVGKERYKESFGLMTAPELPEESLLTTIQKAKGQTKTATMSIEQPDDITFEDGVQKVKPTRVKTDIVRKALEAEKSRHARELSPDPFVKPKALSMNPVLSTNNGEGGPQ